MVLRYREEVIYGYTVKAFKDTPWEGVGERPVILSWRNVSLFSIGQNLTGLSRSCS